MNGAHDMGGGHGFGPVVAEAREPTFHAEWERRVFALTMAAGRAGKWNIDMGRFARENRPPADYLNKRAPPNDARPNRPGGRLKSDVSALRKSRLRRPPLRGETRRSSSLSCRINCSITCWRMAPS